MINKVLTLLYNIGARAMPLKTDEGVGVTTSTSMLISDYTHCGTDVIKGTIDKTLSQKRTANTRYDGLNALFRQPMLSSLKFLLYNLIMFNFCIFRCQFLGWFFVNQVPTTDKTHKYQINIVHTQIVSTSKKSCILQQAF